LATPSAKSALCQKLSTATGVPRVMAQVERLDHDHHPGCQRHRQQQQRHGPGDEVALLPEVDQSELHVHENS